MIKTENIGLPEFGPSQKFDVKNYVVKYMRADVADKVAMAELELLETRGLEGKDIIILSKNNYSFMRDYFIVVNYMERKPKEEEKDK